MDLFRVETGSIPGQSCSEETMPILKRSTSKDEPALTSKAFLIDESLTCIANLTVTFANSSNKSKDSIVKPTSSVKQRDNETGPPKSSEYRCLSPKNLEDPLYPNNNNNNNVSAKADDCETELLLKKTNNYVSNKDENELKPSSKVSGLAASQPDQPSTSSTCLSGTSAPDSGKKKTLGELAKEWNSSQSPEQKKAEKPKINNAVNETTGHDDEEILVRHTTYYSTSSSVHGMSSHECRLRNKLKARRHLNHDEVYQEKKKAGSPTLVKLHAIATE